MLGFPDKGRPAMKINILSHVNVRTAQLEAMIAWYGDILDMHPGPRPDFKFPGAWLYAAGNPYIHFVGVKAEPKSLEPKIEHFAFEAEGMAGFLAKLTERGISHSVDPVPGFPLVQVNLRDPDGNHIHVDFSTDEAGHKG